MLPGGLGLAGSEGIGGNVGVHVPDIESGVQGLNRDTCRMHITDTAVWVCCSADRVGSWIHGDWYRCHLPSSPLRRLQSVHY